MIAKDYGCLGEKAAYYAAVKVWFEGGDLRENVQKERLHKESDIQL